MENMNIVEFLTKRHEARRSNRYNWDSHWEEVAKYFVPKKDDIYGFRIGGEERNNYLYDSTTIHAVELLASALHSMLTNPSLKFFGLASELRKLNVREDVKLYLQECAEIMHDTFNNSNFQTEIHEVYIDLVSFGTGFLLIEEDKEKTVRFTSKPIYEIYIEENQFNEVDAFSRSYKYNIDQIIKEFGQDVVPEDMRREASATNNMKYTIIHDVCPRLDLMRHKELGKLNIKNATYASYHFIPEKKILLRESGFSEFPAAVPRWTKLSGEEYGRSPAMKSLPDGRGLQQMMKTTIRAAQKVVDPPLQVSDDGQYRPVRLTPGATNYMRNGNEIKPIITGARIDLGEQIMESVRNRIRQNFFIDQLQLNDGPQMTAEEVRQRTDDKLRLLGPILGRQHNELLRPLIDRVFAILGRQGKLPQPPAILRKNRNLKVNYISSIARVQKSSEAQNLLRAVGDMVPFIERDPSVLDVIDTKKAFRYVADLRGVPQELMRSEREVQAMEQAQQQQMAAEQENEQQQQQADVVSKLKR